MKNMVEFKILRNLKKKDFYKKKKDFYEKKKIFYKKKNFLKKKNFFINKKKVLDLKNFFLKNFFFRRVYLDNNDIYFIGKLKKRKFILKLFFFKFLRYLMIKGKLGLIKKYVGEIFFKIKSLNFNPFLILVHALYNSILFFEYKRYTNKRKGKGRKRMKKKDVKIYFNPIIINRKRQIFLGFKILKKFSFLNTSYFYKRLVSAALNKGSIIKYVKGLNNIILSKYYLIKKEVKKRFFFFRKYYWRYVRIMILKREFINEWA